MTAEPALARALEGSTSEQTRVFEALYRAHYSALLLYACRRFPQRSDDVVAETFVVCWRRLSDVPADALPWLYGVARRVIADFRRSDRRQTALVERAARLREPEGMAELTDTGLELALLTLSETDRELLLLVHWEDLDPARAAQALGCTRATAATRLWRARRRLRAALERTGGERR